MDFDLGKEHVAISVMTFLKKASGRGLSHPPLWSGGGFWEGEGLPVTTYLMDTWNEY